jgi:hypothetical protein
VRRQGKGVTRGGCGVTRGGCLGASAQSREMSVLLETSKGDLVIDLFVDQCPIACKNFLKLCKCAGPLARKKPVPLQLFWRMPQRSKGGVIALRSSGVSGTRLECPAWG